MPKYDYKKYIEQEAKDEERELDHQLHKEADEALYCSKYGPCAKCLERERNSNTDKEIRDEQ